MRPGDAAPLRVTRFPRHSLRWAAELLWSLSLYRVGVRYKETLFGFGWIFLQPIGLTFIFTYIQRVANIPSGEIPYAIFAGIGVIFWSLTALVVSQSAGCLTGHAPILKKVAFPKVLLPGSILAATMADFCVMGLLLILLFLHYHVAIPPTAGWLFALLFLQFAFLLGLSCLVSLANVFLRDVGHAVPSLLQLWFFASPVFYPFSMVPEVFRPLSQWNPMTGFIEGYRAVLALGTAPPAGLLGRAAIVTAVTLAAGLFCFHRLEGTIADEL